jgi:hypothetical protein
MKWDRLFHILRFLHFSDIRNEPDNTDKNYDRLWKMRTIFDELSGAYAKYYNPTEHLTFDENSMLSFSNSIYQKKYKWFGIKIYRYLVSRDIYKTC